MVTRNEEKKLKKQNPHSGTYDTTLFIIIVMVHLFDQCYVCTFSKIFLDQFHERRETINYSVNTDIEKIFRGKTSAQLLALKSQINQKISGGGTVDIGELGGNYCISLGPTDQKLGSVIFSQYLHMIVYTGYWESLLQELNVFMAKSRLRENHQKLLKEKLATLKCEVCFVAGKNSSHFIGLGFLGKD